MHKVLSSLKIKNNMQHPFGGWGIALVNIEKVHAACLQKKIWAREPKVYVIRHKPMAICRIFLRVRLGKDTIQFCNWTGSVFRYTRWDGWMEAGKETWASLHIEYLILDIGTGSLVLIMLT